jgi:hypothetical protein
MKKKSETKRTKWSTPQLQTHIRKESQTSINVVFTDHVKKRMKLRKITMSMVIATLQNGSIKRTPEPNLNKGTLECRMEYFVAGFDVGVVVAISDDDPSLVLVTALYV